MSQLNIHMTPAFERALRQYMRARGIKTKSQAIRTAIEEALEQSKSKPSIPWKQLLGSASHLTQTPRRQWLTDDDLWEKK